MIYRMLRTAGLLILIFMIVLSACSSNENTDNTDILNADQSQVLVPNDNQDVSESKVDYSDIEPESRQESSANSGNTGDQSEAAAVEPNVSDYEPEQYQDNENDPAQDSSANPENTDTENEEQTASSDSIVESEEDSSFQGNEDDSDTEQNHQLDVKENGSSEDTSDNAELKNEDNEPEIERQKDLIEYPAIWEGQSVDSYILDHSEDIELPEMYDSKNR